MPKRPVDTLPMPAAYFRLILRRFGGTPRRAAQIVAETGFDPVSAMACELDDEITLSQQLQQMRNLADLAQPEWGLLLGSALNGAAHGALGAAVTSAPDLGSSLRVLERFGHVRAPYFRLASSETGAHHLLHISPQLRLEGRIWIPLLESLLLSIQAMVETALGQPMDDARILVDHAAPPYAARYAEFFHAPVSFGAPESRVEIPLAWRELACPFADAASYQTALSQLESAERALQSPRHLVAQVERLLEGAGDPPPTMEQIATDLRLSRRTLVRKLEASNTNFRALTNAHRGRRAQELLLDVHLTVSEVAYRLGYSEPANFARAFRRWFGTSPALFRKAKAGTSPESHVHSVAREIEEIKQ